MTQERRQPWQAHPAIWPTESSFFVWLRGQIRRIWSTYPPKIVFKNSLLMPPPPDYRGRAKKLGECHYCGQHFPGSSLEVDHVQQVGNCTSWAAAKQYLETALECNNNWTLACRPCHKIKSYAERQGLSFQQAAAEKKAIEWMKKPVKEVLAFCAEHGYNAKLLTNAAKRREALSEIFKKGESNG